MLDTPAASFRTGPKRPVNLTLNCDLLRVGKALGLNVSSIAEEALAQAIRTRMAQGWLEANAAAIQAYNLRVEAQGVFSDGLRTF